VRVATQGLTLVPYLFFTERQLRARRGPRHGIRTTHGLAPADGVIDLAASFSLLHRL